MAGVNAKNVLIFMDQYEMTGDLNSVDFPDEIEAIEDTRFGNSARKYYPGLDTSTCTWDGFWKGGAVTDMDTLLSARLASATRPLISVCWDADTVGNRAHVIEADETKYDISAGVGGSVMASVEWQASGGKEYGVLLQSKTAVTATGNGTAVNNGGATTNGWVAHMHVTSASGTTPTLDVTLEHSADNVTFAALTGGAFAQATAITKERLEGTGTVNQYVRAARTVGGTSPSFVAPVIFCRKVR